jgi:uncharacterized membrane protein
MTTAATKIVPKITDAEIAARREGLRQGAANNAIEGVFSTPTTEALMERYATGELDDDQIIIEIHKLNGKVPNASL